MAAGLVYEAWLSAFNSGDKAQIQAFYDEHLGDPVAAFPSDNAEDSCGLDPVRVESQSAQAIKVLLAERCFPALQRLTIELGAAGEPKLKTLMIEPIGMSQRAAANALFGIAQRLSDKDAFAGSLLLVRNGDAGFAKSWGTLDRDGDAPIKLDTPMFLASAGKMFTAVSVLQLLDAGKIDLDAPLGRYLTDYPNKDMAQVTIRQLLQHRGGTGDMGILARDEGANRAQLRSIADIIAYNGDRGPSFEPGSKAEYSNYGFLLLGAVVERVSGQSYYDYVAEHVFKPAGMTHAGFPDLDHLEGVAMGYTSFFGEEAELQSMRSVLPWRGTPGGGGVASARDMAAFMDALQSGKLLSDASFKLAITPGDQPWSGMGFVTGPAFLGNWGHGGNSYGMDVAIHRYPGIDTDFVCLGARDLVCDRLITAWFLRVFGLPE